MEAVVRIGGLGIASFWRNKQPPSAQQVEQSIAAASHALYAQQRGDSVQELARAQPGKLRAHGLNLVQHLLGTGGLPGLALVAIVEALPAHAVESAA